MNINTYITKIYKNIQKPTKIYKKALTNIY